MSLTWPVQLSGNEITPAVRAAGASGDGEPASDPTTGIYEPVTETIINPNAATDITGWSEINSQPTHVTAAFTRDTAVSMFGGTSFKLVVAADNTTPASAAVVESATVTSAAPGDVWSFGGWIDVSAFVDSSGGALVVIEAVIDRSVGGQVFHSLVTYGAVTAGWVYWRYDGLVMPADTTDVGMRIDVLTGTGGGACTVTLNAGGLMASVNGIAQPFTPTSRAGGRIQVPVTANGVTALTPAQGSLATRVRVGFSSAVGAGSYALLSWSFAAGHLLLVYYDGTTNTWVVEWYDGSAHSATVAGGSFAAGSEHTVVAYWTATAVALSVDGGAFSTTVRSSVGTVPSTVVDLGSTSGSSQWADCDLFYALLAPFVPSAADVAALSAAGRGVTDVTVRQLHGSVYQGAVLLPGANLAAGYRVGPGVRTGLDVKVLLAGGHDLRPDMNTIPAFAKDGVFEDTTGFGVEDQVQEYTGMRKFAFGVAGFYRTIGSAEALEALEGVSTPACVGLAGNVLGASFTGFQSAENTYMRSAKVGAFTHISAGFVHTAGGGGIDEGVMLQPLGAVTADGNSGVIDQGAASSDGLVAYLQLPALVLGGATNLAVKLQDSADNSSFADLTGGAFVAVTAAPNAQRIVVTGAVRRYVQAVWTWTGGAGGASTATIFIGINIGTVVSGQLMLEAPTGIDRPPLPLVPDDEEPPTSVPAPVPDDDEPLPPVPASDDETAEEPPPSAPDDEGLAFVTSDADGGAV